VNIGFDFAHFWQLDLASFHKDFGMLWALGKIVSSTF
jgi:hypothetical protein